MKKVKKGKKVVSECFVPESNWRPSDCSNSIGSYFNYETDVITDYTNEAMMDELLLLKNI